jgi:predicted NBD/HSP70 family sugar kinase
MNDPTISVLQAIHRFQPVTRAGLRRKTGLSVNRTGTSVASLVARRLVRETASQGNAPGRPAALLSVEPDIGRIVGLDIGGRTSRAVLTDLSGEVLASSVTQTEVVADSRVILDDIAELVETACTQARMASSQVTAIGVGVQGIVDARSGMVLSWPNTPEWAESWRGLHVPNELSKRLGVGLIMVDDSVRSMATAACRFGQARGESDFLFVYLGDGVGGGVFVDGCSYAGCSGIAGEIGHVTVDETGPWCSCGNRGCLETMASTSAILRRVRERLAEPRVMSVLREPFEVGELTLEAVTEAASAGDKLAFQVLDETGTYVGKVLAIALNLYGPELVILGGPVARADGIILEAVQRQVRLNALQHVSRRARIVNDGLGDLAGARGAALQATEALFDSDTYLARAVERYVSGL